MQPNESNDNYLTTFNECQKNHEIHQPLILGIDELVKHKQV